MALAEELDQTIRKVHNETQALEARIEDLRREIAQNRQIEGDALRLYRSTTGSPHPLEERRPSESRDRPRAEQVMAVMKAAGRPVTLTELVDAMPDNPERGAISAVVHRAVRRGEVRRLSRGVYELVEALRKAS